MQSGTRRRSTIYAIATALIACVVIMTCEAAGRFVRPVATGQPQELINRPICGGAENLDELHYCELVDD